LKKATSVLITAAILIIAGCVSSPKYQAKRKPQLKWKVGEETILESTVGIASYYGDEFAGKLTANGEIFNPEGKTCAHRTYPFGTKIKVVNLKNGLSTIVRVNDRGPFVSGRTIDLSRAAAAEIGMLGEGTARVRLEILEWGEEQ